LRDRSAACPRCPNADLRPERSLSYEVASPQALTDLATFDVAGFRTDFDDLIEPGIAISNGNSAYIQWRNVTKARVQGFETSFKFGFFDGGLLYSLGYTYVYPEDISNARPPEIPSPPSFVHESLRTCRLPHRGC